MSQSLKRIRKENKRKHCVVVENLPLRATVDEVRNFLNQYVPVESVAAIHTDDAFYTRRAKVRLTSRAAVKEIKGRSLIWHGKRIEVKTYFGKHAHKDLFKEGDIKVRFNGYFEPGTFAMNNLERNLLAGQRACEELEEVIHRFNYRHIHILYHGDFYSGDIVVTFGAGSDIQRITREVIRQRGLRRRLR